MFKNEQGFTLMEMLMVMFIIAILLLLTIPNITKQKEGAETTGCESYASMVQTQVTAYELNEGKLPKSLKELQSSGYIKSETCNDGTKLKLTGSEVNIAK